MPNEMNMTSTPPAAPTFREGDQIVLAHGPYQGTPCVFLRLRPDINWAEITDRNGEIRRHPVIWLAHAASAASGYAK